MLTTTCVTQEIFEAFLKCPRKSHLISESTTSAQTEFAQWQGRLAEKYIETATARLRSALRPNEWYLGTLPVERLRERCYRLVFDYTIAETNVHARLHALELDRSRTRPRHHSYVPIRFVPRETLTASDRLLLAFDTVAFWRATGELPAMGKIVHGQRYLAVRVPLPKLIRRVRSVIEKVAKQQTESLTPAAVLNKHCAECQFQSTCRQIACEKDDLSLLPTINEKERKKFHEKGIFTVTQLSYAFRPRRRPAPGVPKHFPALKALAIREHKIHVLGAPTLNVCGTPVYLDVEGDVNRDFYYLIGMRTGSEPANVQHSLWADAPAAEEKIWGGFLEKLSQIDRPRLIHYGSYETQFLRRMRARYPDTASPAFLDELARSALNLLSIIYAHVYFPTYSNGLKEVGQYLGCHWSEQGASGL